MIADLTLGLDSDSLDFTEENQSEEDEFARSAPLRGVVSYRNRMS